MKNPEAFASAFIHVASVVVVVVVRRISDKSHFLEPTRHRTISVCDIYVTIIIKIYLKWDLLIYTIYIKLMSRYISSGHELSHNLSSTYMVYMSKINECIYIKKNW